MCHDLPPNIIMSPDSNINFFALSTSQQTPCKNFAESLTEMETTSDPLERIYLLSEQSYQKKKKQTNNKAL